MPFIILCGFGVRLMLAPMMLSQMVLINKISQASPNIRMAAKLFKHSKLPFFPRVWHTFKAMLDFSKQTNISLWKFYFYNIVQIPVFIVMVLSIRKVATEEESMTGAGMWWFKNLNDPDPYLILPVVATILNYINLGVSNLSSKFMICVARNNKGERALVREPLPVFLPSTAVLPPALHARLARRRLSVLDRFLVLRDAATNSDEAAVVFEQNQPELLLRLRKDVLGALSIRPRELCGPPAARGRPQTEAVHQESVCLGRARVRNEAIRGLPTAQESEGLSRGGQRGRQALTT
jgi:hypothetical protein